jgi:hypothetical protein
MFDESLLFRGNVNAQWGKIDMKTIATFRDGLLSGRYNLAFAAFLFTFLMVGLPGSAFAQVASGNPFGIATNAATSVQQTFKSFALAVGGIGMVACLLLGFFGKLNWKWVSTGIGVSFALAIIPTAIGWLASLGN